MPGRTAHDEIGELLRAGGVTRREVAERLGVSASTVSRAALRLGLRAPAGRRAMYDWEAIRAYYEEGHTVPQCREHFGFSAGAWDQAVSRGDVIPRSTPDPARHAHKTRNAVAKLLEAGRTQAEISTALAISKSTVAFHVRALGIAPDPRFSRRYDWEAVQRAYDEGLTGAECCRRFGFSKATWSQAVRRGAIRARPRGLPLSELLVAGVRRGHHNLKRRLIEAGIKENRCELCSLTDWMEQPLNMALHHVNGDGTDNRLENLILLCPNCHAQTDTYGGRNGHRRKKAA